MTALRYKRVVLAVVLIAAGLFAVRPGSAARAEEPEQSANEPKTEPKGFPYISPEIQRLTMYVGPWRVTERHFNASGDVVATVKGTEEITWLLDRRAIQRAYNTVSDTASYKALGTLTYNTASKRYEGVWFDNMSTFGPVTVTADWDDDARTMTYTLEARGPGGDTKTYKRIEEFPDEPYPERRTAATFEVKGTTVTKLFEVQYVRSKPCPSKLQRVFDG